MYHAGYSPFAMLHMSTASRSLTTTCGTLNGPESAGESTETYCRFYFNDALSLIEFLKAIHTLLVHIRIVLRCAHQAIWIGVGLSIAANG